MLRVISSNKDFRSALDDFFFGRTDTNARKPESLAAPKKVGGLAKRAKKAKRPKYPQANMALSVGSVKITLSGGAKSVLRTAQTLQPLAEAMKQEKAARERRREARRARRAIAVAAPTPIAQNATQGNGSPRCSEGTLY